MKTLKKITIIVLILVVAIVVVGMLALRYVSVRALPDYSGDVQLTGLRENVRIVRDNNASPHIYAQNEHDLYMATGYVMAQDRLWQMDLLRRVTMGRLSEIFGADMVKTDHLLRALRMTEKSKMVLTQTENSIVQNLDAFAAGVNAYIKESGSKLPPEFTILGYEPEEWKDFHTVNLIGYMAWDLSGSWQNEVMLHQLKSKLTEEMWLELFPDMENQKTYVHTATTVSPTAFSLLGGNSKLDELGIEITNGSNNWAVTAKKSTSGKALMANDMHLGFGAPGIWYQIHQMVEGKVNVTGVALPGAPFIINGHNDSIAWGMTNLYVDEMDFYVETVSNEQPDHYFYNGEWKPMRVELEKIPVKGGDTVQKTIRFTHHGPVISEFKSLESEVVTMRWTGNDYSNELRCTYLLNHASNWNDFRAALTTMLAVSQNVVYADVKGNIGLQTAGGVPIRKQGLGIHLVRGDTDEYEWNGILPFDSLPSTFNPEEGYVSSANNRTTGPDYPHYIGFWFDNSSRIDRIRQMINERKTLDVNDFMEMQNDQVSVFALKYLPKLIDIVSGEQDLSVAETFAFNSLKGWNGNMAASAVQPALFDLFYLNFMHNVMADELGEETYTAFAGGLMRHVFDHLWQKPESAWFDNKQTEVKESFEMIVIQSFKSAVETLEARFGEDTSKWRWGNLHQLTLKHPLGKVEILDRLFGFNRGPHEVGGSFHTVNPMAYNFHKPFDVVHGASQRHIFNLGNLKESYKVIPTGISGIPASDYYCNQLENFISGTYHPDLFYKEDIEQSKKYEMTLKP